MVEGGTLLRCYTSLTGYRGFESLLLRFSSGQLSDLKNVVDLVERVRREDAGYSQIRHTRVLAGMERVARYEDRRPGLDGQLLGADP